MCTSIASRATCGSPSRTASKIGARIYRESAASPGTRPNAAPAAMQRSGPRSVFTLGHFTDQPLQLGQLVAAGHRSERAS
ncbi:hypothetical protein ACIRLA_40235 [Streptomyces sp. NPDC102364]|uniref:hypothetical protein n=1 Tax=Streptomyces sp. NPDC102364 TaxID=3366161 RepID=UPI0037F9160A